MEERRAESVLGVLYVLSVIFSVSSLISLVTVWQHWTWTLDGCINIDCGCILYGINTFRTFMGGDVKLCQFGIYGLIPTILIGLCLSGYHGYRCCINRNLDKPRIREDVARNVVIRKVVIVSKTRSPYKYWIPIVFVAVLFCCLSLAHAIVMTDGYYKTCDQYRKRLIHLMSSTGPEAEVIHNRLSCGSIFDFMDYLQPDENLWRPVKRIDTGFALRLAIVSTWLNCSVWILICLLSVIMARRKLCCC